MQTCLITGGCGFIGSNFVHYILSSESDINVINFDALTYAGNIQNLADMHDDRYLFIRGDIRDINAIENIFKEYDIHTVINFAAESHVDRSILDPSIFIQTNVLGTANLLITAKKYWEKDGYKGKRFIQVSTDEVYGSLGKAGLFMENTPLAPNSPYSASKAGADMLVRSYYHTFGFPAITTRCSNNYGPYQFPEKLIPLMIHNCMNNKKLPVYGDGMQVRDWLYVEDHCSAIMSVIQKGQLGEVYNIGGNNEKPNIDIVKMILSHFGKSEELIEHVPDRLGHDRRYAIDNTKITTKIGWKPSHTFEDGMKKTIRWYEDNITWLLNITSGGYLTYYKTMYPGVE